MTPAEARQALLDSLLVERFTPYRDVRHERPATPAQQRDEPKALRLIHDNREAS